jgi:hypothetical protein
MPQTLSSYNKHTLTLTLPQFSFHPSLVTDIFLIL